MQQPIKVLIVDDNATGRAVLRSLLQKNFDCEILEASNGTEALESVRAAAPDLIVLDIMLPDMNGNELLELIRGDPEHAKTCVIAVSAVDNKATVREMLALGVRDYVLKPIRLAEIGERFEAVFAEIRAERASAAS